MKKTAFIYFDALHIIHHFLGPVAALIKVPDIQVDILTDEREHTYLFTLLEMLNIPKSVVKKLPTYNYRKIIEKVKKRKQPSGKYLFEKHKDLLLSYDVLIFNDANHEYLHNKRKFSIPKFVMLMHGAGDREYLIGESFKESVSKFDLITTSGDKVQHFYEKMKLPATVLEKCGYQKFDVVKIENKNVKFFGNNKPTVLYNPHFKEGFSSWYHYGRAVLEFFYNNKNYNLIFAPHINLFNKKGFLNATIIDQKYFDEENIRIDLGSNESVNMAYTMVADVYLGDVSSQVYEYLMTPKPCIFINAYKIDWQGDKHFQNWELGKVILNIDTLEKVLDTKDLWQKDFISKQIQSISYTFEQQEESTASTRIAKAILKLI